MIYPLLLGITLEIGVAKEENTSKAGFWVPRVPPRAYYSIECRIDTASESLIGTEVIRFENKSSERLSRLALDWSVNSRQTLKILIDGTSVPILTDSGQATIPSPVLFDLPPKISAGEQITLTINFSLSLSLPGENHYRTWTEWFPRLWWGINTHDDFDVKIEVPPGYALATSGRLNEKTHAYHAENVATFGLFLGKGLHVAEANAGDVLVRCLFTQRGEECARLVLKTAVDVINFYRQYFGFYPYKSLDIVPGAERPMGGYPAATSLSVIHGEGRMSEMPEIHWRWITAHEIGHMYWGAYVLEKDVPGWLWIGLGIYADREYVRARGLSLQMHRELMARYREGVLQHVNTTVAITPEQWEDIDFDFNNIVTHGKGFSIVSALANYLGKEKFNRIYLRCLKEFGGGRLGAAEFQHMCESESGEDLGWFFDQWVHSNKYLSYQVASQNSIESDGRYVSTVSVERLGTIKMPVPVVAWFEDGTSQQKVTDRQLDVNVLEFVSKAPLKQVRIDPDSELALIVPPPEMTAQELTKAIEELPWSGAGRKAAAVFNKARELKPTSEDIWFKLGLMLYDGEYYQQALEAFRRTAELSADSTTSKFAAYVWQGHIFDILGRRDDAIQQYRMALKNEAGHQIGHDQYGMVINRTWVEERLQKPFKRR
jgi:hypothetical protein